MRRRTATRVITAVVTVAAAASRIGPATVTATAAVAPRSPATLAVGRLTLTPCAGVRVTWCGDLPVPLDRTDPRSPDIPIHFEWRPAPSRGSGTIVAVEGGPGYPSTWSREEFVPMLRPLLATRNLLLVDNRGTGESAPVSCPALQHFRYTEPNARWTRLVAACGRRLDHTYRRSDGSFVHASELFGSANAARDLTAVLDALDIDRIDLYGDSYGTYFAQAFATRFPHRLRSLTLDGAYPALDLNPWYPTTATRAVAALDLVCARDLACSALPGTASERLARVVARLRRHPLAGTTRLPRGTERRVQLDPSAIAVLLNNAAGDRGVIDRELDAANRAFLDHDPVPLLRLVAEGTHRGDSGPLRFYSAGLYAAVTCHDYPAAFSLDANPTRRRVEWAHAEQRFASRHPDAYAPFTPTEWLTAPAEDDEEYDACLGWPAPRHTDPAVDASVPLVPPDLPALVLSSDLDSWTPPPGGKALTAQLGPSARWLLVPNTLHVSALVDSTGCASGIVDAFIAAPDQLAHLDASCRSRIPEHHTAGSFVTRASRARPANASTGDEAGEGSLRLATVAVDAVGDVIAQDSYVGRGVGVGLRGGSFTASGTTVREIELHRVRWTNDSTVTGRARWFPRERAVEADVTVTAPFGRIVVHLGWNGLVPHGRAVITGRAPDGRLVATAPAA